MHEWQDPLIPESLEAFKQYAIHVVICGFALKSLKNGIMVYTSRVIPIIPINFCLKV